MRWPEPLRRGYVEVAYRLGGWPRRVAVLFCLAFAAWAAWGDRHGARSDTVDIVVAAHDLGAGVALGAGDVRVDRWPRTLAPGAAVHSAEGAVGRIIAAAMNQGEPITPARLRGTGVTTGLPAGEVAVTVVLANAGAAGLIAPGDRIDILTTSPADQPRSGAGRARLVAADARVLDVLRPAANLASTEATSIVVGADRDTALDLASLSNPVTVTLRGS